MSKICETCKAFQLSKDYWQLSSGVRDKDFLYTRVCQYAVKNGKTCANTIGSINHELGWKGFNS